MGEKKRGRMYLWKRVLRCGPVTFFGGLLGAGGIRVMRVMCALRYPICCEVREGVSGVFSACENEWRYFLRLRTNSLCGVDFEHQHPKQ